MEDCRNISIRDVCDGDTVRLYINDIDTWDRVAMCVCRSTCVSSVDGRTYTWTVIRFEDGSFLTGEDSMMLDVY